jgi:hypothetical protein
LPFRSTVAPFFVNGSAAWSKREADRAGYVAADVTEVTIVSGRQPSSDGMVFCQTSFVFF